MQACDSLAFLSNSLDTISACTLAVHCLFIVPRWNPVTSCSAHRKVWFMNFSCHVTLNFSHIHHKMFTHSFVHSSKLPRVSSRISVKSDGGYGEMPPNSYNDRKDYGGTFPICRNNPHYNNGPGYGQEPGDGKFRYNHRRRRDLDLPQTWMINIFMLMG